MVGSRLRGTAWRTSAILIALAGCGDDDEAQLSCKEADSAFTLELQRDQTLKQLAACTQDSDCELWDPTAQCAAGGPKLPNCSRAIGKGNSTAAAARRDLLAAELCPQIEPMCNIGISCAPNPVARCVQGSCAVSYGP
jgi:hypothetical protein